MKISSISCGCPDTDARLMLSCLLPRIYKGTPLCFIHSYGCAQNVSDGEKIAAVLRDCGYSFTDSPENADLIVLNTCAVRENAEEKVFGHIGGFKALKEKNRRLIIAVAGCMTQQEYILQKLRASYRQVDIAFGTYGAEKLPEMIYRVLTQNERFFTNAESGDMINLPQLRKSVTTASIPIMYGCNNFCSYCIVPYVRGRERSRTPDEVVAEAEELVAAGCKEITLLGQNVNSYAYGFPRLLERINSIDGDFRIRFVSSHPKDAGHELIDAVLSLEKVCKHLHLPVQSGSDEILRAMNRRYTAEDYLKTVDYARSRDADFSFSTDIIVGFPGETEEQFEQTKALLRRVRFDNVFTYVYSRRSGTKAALMPDDVPEKLKGQRLRQLILKQRETAQPWLERFVGKEVRVLCEGEGRKRSLAGKCGENIITEFDGESGLIGSFVSVRITEAANWALFGELV